MVAVDHLVTGLAGGDQETAAELTDVEHRDEIESEGDGGGVLRDRQLTVVALVRSARRGEAGGAR